MCGIGEWLRGPFRHRGPANGSAGGLSVSMIWPSAAAGTHLSGNITRMAPARTIGKLVHGNSASSVTADSA
jgi:hypothetical protein